MPTIRLSYDFIQKAMQSQPVRQQLRARAATIAARADSIGKGEGIDMNTRVESGTRPQGRPYSNATSDRVEQEWGTSNTDRRRILGRARGA